MKLTFKLPLLTLGLGSIVVIIVIATLMVLKGHKTDGLIITIAGKQRMLSQKMGVELLTCVKAASQGNKLAEVKSLLETTMKVFDTTLKSLREGEGAIPGDTLFPDKNMRFPKPSAMVAAALDTVHVSWNKTDKLYQSFAKGGYIDGDAADQFLLQTKELLKKSDTLVTLLRNESEVRFHKLFVIQLVGLFVGFLLVFYSIIVVLGIVKRLNMVNMHVDKMGNGDLTKKIHVEKCTDEIDDTMVVINHLGDNITGIMSELTAANKIVVDVVQEFTGSFDSIEESSNSMKSRSNTVAAASEEASVSVSSISTAAEKMSSSVSSVSASMDQMTASVNEISKISQLSSSAAARAFKEVGLTQKTLEKMKVASNEIGKVLVHISDIAKKTNLLALNASIEAATAGEAGRGFAVVATEVKSLATQTAHLTTDIQKQVDAINDSSKESVDAIVKIATIIEEVNQVSQTVASAVEEQSATTSEINTNFAGASAAAKDVAQNVAETSIGLNEVSQNIQIVNSEAFDVTNKINDVSEMSRKLSQLTGNLTKVIQMFKIKPVFISWTNDMSVLVTAMDDQHKKLIDLINNLSNAEDNGAGRDASIAVVDELVAYTEIHFKEEERLMQQADYDDLPEQKKSHAAFCSKLAEFQQGLKSGTVLLSTDIVTFLKDWLLDHIVGMDKKYGPVLNEKGIK